MGFFEPWSFGQATPSLIYPFSPLAAISDRICNNMITMREHADYVYDQTTFADMQNTGLKRQSQGIRAIFRNHSVNLRSTKEGDVALIDNWLDKKKLGLGDADSGEFTEAVESLMPLGLSGITAEVDGAVAGVIVFEPQMSGNVIVLFAKTDHQYPYLLSLLYNHLAKEIPVGTSINLCQDLGLPGLRQKKLSMKPARLLTKSTLFMPWE